MFSDNHKISLRQLQAMLLLYFLGTSSLFLPAELAAESGRACWIVMLCGGLAASLFSLVLTTLMARAPHWTGVEWVRYGFGNLLGTVFAVGFALKLAIDAMLELRIFSEILCRTMLPQTPVWVLVAVLLLLSAFGVARGIEGQARAAEILFFFVFVPFLLLLAGVALTIDEAYFLPLDLPDFTMLRKGAAAIQPLFQAMLFLLFLPPYLEKPTQTKKSVLGVCLTTTILMSVVTFLCLAVYGVEALEHKIFPTLQVAERISFSGIFLGRQDIFLLWFWMVSAFLYISGALFFGSVCSARILRQKQKKQRYWLFLWVPILFVGAMVLQDMESAYAFRNLIQPFLSAFLLAVLPLYCLYKSRKWKKGGI